MPSIKLHSHVGEDGILQLEVPVGLTNMDVEVTMTVAPVQPEEEVKTPVELGWPPGFFERTAGCLQDDPLVRYPQGELQEREPLE